MNAPFESVWPKSVWLAIYLPRLATDRLIRGGRAPEAHPFAVYAKAGNAFVLSGVNACASALGLHAGQALADARAIYPELAVAQAEPQADACALDGIAAWCERFTPIIVVDAPDGLFLDVSGCGHLFGGDEALRDEIVTRLQAQGFASRAALAATPGAAWGMARHGQQRTFSPPAAPRPENPELAGSLRDPEAEKVAHHQRHAPASFLDAPAEHGVGGGPDEGRAHLAPVSLHAPHPPPPPRKREGELASLPIEALRLDESAAALLRRLGLKTIGQLIEAPRAAFTARAGQRAMLRLDQALGRASEALSPRRPPPPVFALRRFLEPLFSVETILIAAQALCEETAEKLDRRGAGARACVLHLYGVDGRARAIEIAMSRPERGVKVLIRLLREKLDRAAETLDAEFGIEAARLDVVRLERIEAGSGNLSAEAGAAASAEQIAAIVDLLAARLGPARVLRPQLRDAHMPERAGGWGAEEPSPPLRGRGQGEGGRAGGTAEGATTAPPVRSPPVALRATPSPQGGGLYDKPLRRPLTLFSRAQAIEAMASVPDGPPIRFRWRRVLREVARAEGPERIAGDWLKREPTRDYYRVEDKQGRRYWLYREGAYGEAEAPRWYMHGLFA